MTLFQVKNAGNIKNKDPAYALKETVDFLVKTDKYRLTETQLKEMLLVSKVAIGVRVESQEHQDEESTSTDRETSEVTSQCDKDDQISRTESSDGGSVIWSWFEIM